MATPDSLLVLACPPTHLVHQMFFLGFLPTSPDLWYIILPFLLVGGSLTFFLTLVRLCYAFGFSASLLLRCSPTCRFFTRNTLHCKFQRNISSFLSLSLFFLRLGLMGPLTCPPRHRSDDGTSKLIGWPMENITRGGRVGEESSPSFSLSREVLSCADANGVLTWLKLIGDPRADAF